MMKDISYLKLFLIGALFPSFYYLAWFVFRGLGWHWYASLNIPGFLMLLGSLPWSFPVIYGQIELNNLVGHLMRGIIQVFSVIFGFAINFLIVSKLTIWITRKLRLINESKHGQYGNRA